LLSIPIDSQAVRSQVKTNAGSTLWRRLLFILSISIYVAIAGLIYREWVVSFKSSPAQQLGEEKAKANSINYKYFTDAGLQYYQAQDYQKAELAFRKALEYAPDDALGYSNLGSALNGQGKWDEAILVLEKAVSLDSTLTIAKNNLDYAKAEKAKQSQHPR
jgi:tetratricopeptide (TPR) repeat protein